MKTYWHETDIPFMQLHFLCQGGAEFVDLGRTMVDDHNGREIRKLVQPTADHATNVGGTKGPCSFPSIPFYDIFRSCVWLKK